MTTSIVFTFIGEDKTGLIEKLSQTVSSHGGSWLESRMSQLAGQFAGITKVQVPSDQAQDLRAALLAISGADLTVSIREGLTQPINESLRNVKLSLIGNDRPGILKELSSALAARHINVCEMNTHVSSAPMTAEPLFEALAEIQIPRTTDLDELRDQLDTIADDLSVDISLEC